MILLMLQRHIISLDCEPFLANIEVKNLRSKSNTLLRVPARHICGSFIVFHTRHFVGSFSDKPWGLNGEATGDSIPGGTCKGECSCAYNRCCVYSSGLESKSLVLKSKNIHDEGYPNETLDSNKWCENTSKKNQAWTHRILPTSCRSLNVDLKLRSESIMELRDAKSTGSKRLLGQKATRLAPRHPSLCLRALARSAQAQARLCQLIQLHTS